MKDIALHGITNLEPVPGGGDKWYWATDFIHGDLYEAEELFRQGHPIKSNRLYLVRYPDGTVYEPLAPAEGQYFGAPVYDGDAVALLLVDFKKETIRILRFTPESMREAACLPLSAAEDCYNLMLCTFPLSLIRQPNDNTFALLWPEQTRFAIGGSETLNFRDGGRLYFSAWHEDPDYREETVVRALPDGAVLERFSGDIRVMPNGEKWHIR